MSTYVNTQLPKICHARAGSIIRLPNEKTGEVLPARFMLVAIELDKPSTRTRAPYGSPAGLFNEERQLLLVSLETGIARKVPHLSTRVDITKLTLAEVLPDGDIPVLVSAPDESHVRVSTQSDNGREQELYVNLGNPEEVMALFRILVANNDRVREVKTRKELKEIDDQERWRNAVATGETLLSFSEYREQVLV
jgi:hypothetical protein